FSACQQAGKNSTGSEYIPDMSHSIAYEANSFVYYYQNTWGTKEDLHKMSSPRIPVSGTRPRSQGNSSLELSNKGLSSHQAISIPVNGSVPYYYKDTEDDRLKAMAEIVNNPYPITTVGLAKGKELYEVFCGICHGEKGDGAGYLVREDGGKYPVQPANFMLDEHVEATNGRYYHAIYHGRNLMGNYKDKLSYEERWQVIHYIRSLQAQSKGLAYSQKENTFRSNVEVPGDVLKMKETAAKDLSSVVTKEN
ncbi:MAG TPA: cytochrome c, partial [Saprospiraceae bacterium]|nr:cytochrome c [Saprospiraceae bacterium]